MYPGKGLRSGASRSILYLLTYTDTVGPALHLVSQPFSSTPAYRLVQDYQHDPRRKSDPGKSHANLMKQWHIAYRAVYSGNPTSVNREVNEQRYINTALSDVISAEQLVSEREARSESHAINRSCWYQTLSGPPVTAYRLTDDQDPSLMYKSGFIRLNLAGEQLLPIWFTGLLMVIDPLSPPPLTPTPGRGTSWRDVH